MKAINPAPGDRGDRLALMALLGGAAGIAFAPIFVRLSEVGPVATAFWRVALAIPPFGLWLSLEGQGPSSERRPDSLKDYLGLIMAGIFFAGDLAVWHWSIKLTSVANATLLANFAPVFVTLGSRFIFGQKVRALFIVGMSLALAGMILIVGRSFQVSWNTFLGDLFGLTTAFFYAGYILSVKHLRNDFSTAHIMAWSGAVTAVALLPVTLLFGEKLLPLTGSGWLVLVGLAVISHVGGQSLIAFALAHLAASFSSVGLLVQPVLAAFLAWFILSEGLGVFQALGGVLVLIGIVTARRGS
jgi:drug/metabolite transporter (DMT)-like permease